MNESVWEPEEREGFCCYQWAGERPHRATWRWQGCKDGNHAEGHHCWVCDAHKQEPQPPDYAEWLQVTAW